MKNYSNKNMARGVLITLLLLICIISSRSQTISHLFESKTNTSYYKNAIDSSTDSKICYKDSLLISRKLIHRIGLEFRPSFIIPSNEFLRGENSTGKPIRKSFSTHLRYAFQSQPNTCTDLIYKGVYQGIGLAYFNFENANEIGNPLAIYLFQGARIAKISPQVSLNYEWNFGLSGKWKPYDYDYNQYNLTIGSKFNAYMNVNFYLNWMLSRNIDLNTGFELTHFSNGNTKFPNAGLNTTGLKLALIYNFNRETNKLSFDNSFRTPEFNRHISYDLVMFGSWRRKGVDFFDEKIASPYAYPVLGFNFAPMYNLGYKTRIGISLDGVYDHSAGIYTEDYIMGTEQEFFTPPFKEQLALGFSGRFEYVMPYFSVNVGLGANAFYKGKDFRGLYQILALKTDITRNCFIHIGYCLQNFHDPNYLMLGIGFRFNNNYPSLWH